MSMRESFIKGEIIAIAEIEFGISGSGKFGTESGVGTKIGTPLTVAKWIKLLKALIIN